MAVDLGAGDGSAVLRLAKSSPRTLVIGVDTSAAGLIEASRKAARGGVDNAVFVVADATDALVSLRDRVDVLTITLPWGSLLRRVLEGEREFALAVAGAL